MADNNTTTTVQIDPLATKGKERGMDKALDDDDDNMPANLRDIVAQVRITLKICWELAGDQRKNLVYGYLTVLGLEAIAFITPWLISRLTSLVIRQGKWFQWQNALALMLMIYLSWAAWLVFDVLRDHLAYQFRRRLDRDLTLMAARKMISLSRAFHQSHNTGELASKVSRGSMYVSQVLDLLQFNVMTRVTYIIGTLVLLPIIHWSLLIPALLALIANVLLMLRSRLLAREEYKKRHDVQTEVESLTSETIANVLTVQANGCEQEALQKIIDKRDAMLAHRVRENRIEIKSWTLLGLLSNQFEWAMIVLAIYLLSVHVYSVSTFLFVTMLIIKYREELFHFGWMYDHFMEMTDAIQRLYRVLREKVMITDPETPLSLPVAGQAKIELRDVSFSYRPEKDPAATRWALKGVSLGIEPGTVLGVAGLSGGGKSTLINLLLRLDDPTQGEVCFNGLPLNRVRLRELRSRIGYVEQYPRLFKATIAENIAFHTPCTPEEIVAAAKIAGAHDFIMEMEKGYETNALDRGARLSGGQMQRIAIARAIIRKPALLILDEPTSSVDPYSISRIMDALEQLKGTCTMVLVSHQLSTLQRLADRLIIVRGGQIVEEGTHEQLMKHNGLYAELVDIQQREDRLS